MLVEPQNVRSPSYAAKPVQRLANPHQELFSGSIYEDAETTRANAMLMAAAPDLFEVAQLILDTATIETPPGLLAAAEVAISRATDPRP